MVRNTGLCWLSLGLVILVLLFLAGCCSHPVEVASLKDVEVKQEKYFTRYSVYVDSDPKLTAAEKNDTRATLEAIKRQTTSARKAIEGKD